jgi:hypothetical protein
MNKKISIVGASLVIFCCSIILSIYFYTEARITSLLFYDDTAKVAQSVIVPGSPVQSTIRAAHNNLSTIKLRIDTFNRLNTSHIIFRLKKHGDSVWTVTNTYTIDRFEDGLMYGFGFPPIVDSKDKSYTFELQSIDGTNDNSIGVTSGFHSVASVYTYTRLSITKSTNILISFLRQKAQSLLVDPYFLGYLGIFLIPGLVYFLEHVGIPKERKNVVLQVFVLYTLLYFIYVPVRMHTNIPFFLSASVWYMARIMRQTSTYIYALALLCLGFVYISILIHDPLASQRASICVFFLLVSGGMMTMRQLRNN